MTPKRKTLKREKRLNLAKLWLEQYEGKNIWKGYSRNFAVDYLCAFKELEMLGVIFDEKYKESVIAGKISNLEYRRKQKEVKKKEKELKYFWSDEDLGNYYNNHCFLSKDDRDYSKLN